MSSELCEARDLRGIGGLETGKDQDDKPTGDCPLSPIYRFPDLRLFPNRPLAISARAITIGLCSFSVRSGDPFLRRGFIDHEEGVNRGSSRKLDRVSTGAVRVYRVGAAVGPPGKRRRLRLRIHYP